MMVGFLREYSVWLPANGASNLSCHNILNLCYSNPKGGTTIACLYVAKAFNDFDCNPRNSLHTPSF